MIMKAKATVATIILSIALMSVLGCSKKSQLIGTWISTSVPDRNLTFRKDHKLIIFGEVPQSGTKLNWDLKGNIIHVSINDEYSEFIIKYIDNNNLELLFPNRACVEYKKY